MLTLNSSDNTGLTLKSGGRGLFNYTAFSPFKGDLC